MLPMVVVRQSACEGCCCWSRLSGARAEIVAVESRMRVENVADDNVEGATQIVEERAHRQRRVSARGSKHCSSRATWSKVVESVQTSRRGLPTTMRRNAIAGCGPGPRKTETSGESC